MKKLGKQELKKIKGGETFQECIRRCRLLLNGCPGKYKSDCPEYIACINSCEP